MVCRLVAETFLGPRPEGTQISHLNGNPSDNRPVNLVYETPAENNKRRIAHGTANFSNSLSPFQIEALRAIAGYDVIPLIYLARLTDTSEAQIHRIINRKSRKGT